MFSNKAPGAADLLGATTTSRAVGNVPPVWQLFFRTSSRHRPGFFFVHLDQNSGRDKTQVLAETQVFLPKTQLFFSPKLRFPKLSKSLYYISFSKTQPEQRKTHVKILKTQVS